MADKSFRGNTLLVVSFLVALSVILVFSSFFVEKKPAQQEPAKEENISVPTQEVNENAQLNISEKETNETVEVPIQPQETDREAEFLRDSHEINRTFISGYFKAKLLRVGFYNDTMHEQKIFRADIWIKNIGLETKELYISEGNVWYNWMNYTASGGEFGSPALDKQEERSGHVLFPTVPRSISGNVEITIAKYYSYTPVFGSVVPFPITFNVALPLLYEPRKYSE